MNEDWTDTENDRVVADYFQMLICELKGLPFNKAEHNRNLQQEIQRGRGSIEFKHQNISAVLKAMGETWVFGYKPLFKYQASLEEAVARWFLQHPEWFPNTKEAEFAETPALFIGQPPTLRNSPPPEELEKTLSTAQKFDVAGRDERNRRLGKAGEELIFLHECRTLTQNGRKDLSAEVRWVSRDDGDGAGYDIASFEANGRARLIEVKTTNGWERTPFYISRNELEVAKTMSESWNLVRVWNFSREPKAFELRPPLDQHVSLMPTSFQASFQ